MIFLLDASQISDEDYYAEKQFVKDLAHHLNISLKGPRASAVIYGSNPQTVAEFSDPDFQGKVDKAPHLKTPRRVDKALNHAAEVFNTMGRNGSKIVVFLMLGNQVAIKEPIGQAANRLRFLGARAYPIVVGTAPTNKALAAVVEKPQDIFRVSSTAFLSSKIEGVSKRSKFFLYIIAIEILFFSF